MLLWLPSARAQPGTVALPASSASQTAIALYYGANPPVTELSAFDVAVVEPETGFDPKKADTPHTAWFAYVSVGEVTPERPYAKAMPPAWFKGRNAAWGSNLVDQSSPGWPRFYVEHVIKPLWDKGYRGFFLDTLDAYQRFSKTDAERQQQQAGLVAVIRAIKASYPAARLIFNRGFEILPQVHDLVYAVAFESLFRGWDQEKKRYTEVPQSDRDWLMAQVKTIREQYHLPVLAIDYCAPEDRQCARDTAAKIRALGIIPYVTDPLLQTVGIGSIEVMPRRVLIVQDPAPRTNLNVSDGLRFVAMPLNYLGYRVEYLDVNHDTLPEQPLNDRYAGIVVWLNDAVAHPAQFRAWLEKQIHDGMHVAIMNSFGTPVDGAFAKTLDLQPVPGTSGPQLRVESQDPKFMGFEMQPTPNPQDVVPIRAGASGRSLLRLKSGNFEVDAAALMPWGGYVVRPFAEFELSAIAQSRWVVQPIEFLRAALRLPDMPVPDTTTENGRRLFMTHIDGDGLASKAEFSEEGDVYSGDAIYRVLAHYGFPTTVSVIEAGVSDRGPYSYAADLRKLARRIFELPNVEMASHTFTHPLRWMEVTGLGVSDSGSTAEGSSQTDSNGLSFNIPGYTFNIQSEIGGSINWIDQKLAPPGKKVKVLLWSGDCQVPGVVVKAAYDAGVMNLNGGDTFITKSFPSWTAIAPLDALKDGYYQIFAPNQNEEIYTGLWNGPFYGFRRVIETFRMTDEPIRFKPIDVYYHFFTGTKLASIKALDTVYDYVRTQPVNPVFVSEYAQKVLDFEHTSVARAGNQWLVRNAGHLRTMRLAPGMVPDLLGATGVAGYVPGPGGTYVNLTGSEARFAVIAQNRAPRVPYLADANGRIGQFERTAKGISFDLSSYAVPAFRLANVSACRVRADGQALSAARAGGGLVAYSAPARNASKSYLQTRHIDVDCGT